MKLVLCCSRYFYDKIPKIKTELERLDHNVTMPNGYYEPSKEDELRSKDLEERIRWKREMLKRDKDNIRPNDGILVLNFDKNGQPNYIGGATFLEIYAAFDLEKLIFLYNPVPENIFRDELLGIEPIVIDQDLRRIRSQT